MQDKKGKAGGRGKISTAFFFRLMDYFYSILPGHSNPLLLGHWLLDCTLCMKPDLSRSHWWWAEVLFDILGVENSEQREKVRKKRSDNALEGRANSDFCPESLAM